jgi:cytochrome c553
MKIVYILLLVMGAFLSCKDSENTSNKARPDFYAKQTAQQVHPGKKLMETYCYACHNASTPEDKRLAPPMIAIKRRYIFKDTSKEEFINDMQTWIKNPNEKDAKMYGAVKRFGVMLKMPYPEETIEQIADYMYTNDIEQPEWFEDHFKQMNKDNMNMKQ